jgi:hypothetical protein
MSITAIGRYFVGDPNIVAIVTDDNLATITTAGYLTGAAIAADIEALQNGEFQWTDTDIVLINYAPDNLVNWFKYDADNATFVANPAAGGLSNSLLNGRIFVGNASNIATGVAMSGDITTTNAGVTSIGANKVLSSMISPLVEKYVAVPMTAAQFNGMYATPFLILDAQGANTLIVVKRAVLAMTFVSAAFANGGVVGFQYDSTAHGAGVAASNTEAAADFFAAASTSFAFNGVSGDTVAIAPFTTSVNKGIYLSNLTGAFDTGDNTFVVHLWYSVIPTV